jgi:hypothetical protein
VISFDVVVVVVVVVVCVNPSSTSEISALSNDVAEVPASAPILRLLSLPFLSAHFIKVLTPLPAAVGTFVLIEGRSWWKVVYTCVQWQSVQIGIKIGGSNGQKVRIFRLD